MNKTFVSVKSHVVPSTPCLFQILVKFMPVDQTLMQPLVFALMSLIDWASFKESQSKYQTLTTSSLLSAVQVKLTHCC
jgi:hypothetical protein